MSNTNNIKIKATHLKKFINEKGYAVKHTECIEAVSRMETGHCYNIAKEQAIRILQSGENLTYNDMKKSKFHIDIVIPIEMDIVIEGIDALNDRASEIITGSPYALCGINYEVFPYYYGNNTMAMRVTAYVEDIECLNSLPDYEDSINNMN